MVSCDFGLVSEYITPKTGDKFWLACRPWQWQETREIFQCIAPENPGIYEHICQINPQNQSDLCKNESVAQTFQVLSKDTPIDR
jgi:hypothetical protein